MSISSPILEELSVEKTSSMEPPLQPPTFGALRRITTLWRAKLILGSFMAILFWSLYYMVPVYALGVPTQMPSLLVDRAIPFIPFAVWIYVAQFVTCPIIGWFMASRRDLTAYFVAHALLFAITFTIFILMPTYVIIPPLPSGSKMCDLIRAYDSSLNAFPSFHASFGVLGSCCASVAFRGLKFERALVSSVWIFTVMVFMSALSIKQHVILDLMGGTLVALICAFVFYGISGDKKLLLPKY